MSKEKRLCVLAFLFLTLTCFVKSNFRLVKPAKATAPICLYNPATGKSNLCYCIHETNKDKLTLVLKERGLFDTVRITNAAQEYLRAVEQDLGVENVGIEKTRANSIQELDTFVEDLYTRKGTGYILLLGDDLPVSSDIFAIPQKLESVPGDFAYDTRCREIAISYILPPILYPPEEKINILKATLEKYVTFHRDSSAVFKNYSPRLLQILDPSTGYEPLEIIPNLVTVGHTSQTQIHEAFLQKQVALRLDVHGAETALSFSLEAGSSSTSLEDYSHFVGSHGLPALFVDSGACQAITISYGQLKDCCWPQIFLKSGALAYYSIGGGGDETLFVHSEIYNGIPLGEVILRKPHTQNFIFGDLMAYFPPDFKERLSLRPGRNAISWPSILPYSPEYMTTLLEEECGTGTLISVARPRVSPISTYVKGYAGNNFVLEKGEKYLLHLSKPCRWIP